MMSKKNILLDINVKAEIRSLTNYGAFVELEPGVEGLIHISDLSWIKKVSHPSEVLTQRRYCRCGHPLCR